jgi:hypothetical protein
MSFSRIAHNIRVFSRRRPDLMNEFEVIAINATVDLLESYDEPLFEPVITAIHAEMWSDLPALMLHAMAGIADNLDDRLTNTITGE